MKTNLSVLLNVRNGSQAIEFYKRAFNATVIFQMEEGGALAHLDIEGNDFWLADEAPEFQNASPETLGGSSARMILTVSDPDAVFARAVSAGAKEVWPVEDKDYGWRVGRVVDPFGHHWEIGKPLR